MAVQVLQEGITTLAGLLANGDSLRILRGGQTVLTGLDNSGIAGIANLEIGPAAAVNLGGGGTNFQAGVTGTLSHAGTGRLYYVANATVTDVCVRAKLIGTGQFYGRGGTITRFEQSNGIADVDASTIVTTAAVTGGSYTAAFITGADGYANAYFSGGTVYSERGTDTDIATAEIRVTGGCECHIARSNITPAIAAAPGATNMPMAGVLTVTGPGSYCDWQGFTITTLVVLGGAVIDMSACPVSFTVTTLVTDRRSLYSSRWQSKVPGVTITYPAVGASRIILGANDDTIPG